MKLLHVDSSIFAGNSVSKDLSSEIVAQLVRKNPNISVTHQDLAETPIGHLTGDHMAVAQGAPVKDSIKADLALGHSALEAFLAADVIVVGAPMYNFGIPSQLKAWIDRLAVPGKTFQYGKEGPAGLCGGKRVIIASSRGGVFSEGSALAYLDHQESYLRAFFGFIGITDVTFVRAEAVALSPESRTASIAAAKKQIEQLAA